VRKKRKDIYEVSGSSLVGFGTVSTDKSFLQQENIAYIFRSVQWKNNGIVL
jgi:hypothetical protein